MAYIENTRKRTLAVLVQIFEGDMIEAWAAYISIYPHSTDVIDNDALPEVMKLSTQYKPIGE